MTKVTEHEQRFIAVYKLKPKLCLSVWFPLQIPKVLYSGFLRVKG